MPIVATDIKLYKSGTNNLGGVISNTEIVSGTANSIFINVSSDEALLGNTDYACIYIKNTHANITLENTKVYFNTGSSSPDIVLELGLGTSTIGNTEQSIPNKDTAPSGVTFSSALGSINSLTVGNLPPSGYKAIWIKRTVAANAIAINDSFDIGITGDTTA